MRAGVSLLLLAVTLTACGSARPQTHVSAVGIDPARDVHFGQSLTVQAKIEGGEIRSVQLEASSYPFRGWRKVDERPPSRSGFVTFRKQRPTFNTRYRAIAVGGTRTVGRAGNAFVYPRDRLTFGAVPPYRSRLILIVELPPRATPRPTRVYFYVHQNGTSSYGLIGTARTYETSRNRLAAVLTRRVRVRRRDRYFACTRDIYADGMGRKALLQVGCGNKSITYPLPYLQPR